jgi:hypothetical protein
MVNINGLTIVTSILWYAAVPARPSNEYDYYLILIA